MAVCNWSSARFAQGAVVDQSESSKARRAAGDRAIHVLGAGRGDGSQQLPGGRTVVVELVAGQRRDQVTVDEQAGLRLARRPCDPVRRSNPRHLGQSTVIVT